MTISRAESLDRGQTLGNYQFSHLTYKIIQQYILNQLTGMRWIRQTMDSVSVPQVIHRGTRSLAATSCSTLAFDNQRGSIT